MLRRSVTKPFLGACVFALGVFIGATGRPASATTPCIDDESGTMVPISMTEDGVDLPLPDGGVDLPFTVVGERFDVMVLNPHGTPRALTLVRVR